MSLIPKVGLFTAHKQSLGQGNVFSRVCHSDHDGEKGWLLSMYLRSHFFRLNK